jgi:uncharacterized protein YprB with RNaseH-like and TPR domain
LLHESVLQEVWAEGEEDWRKAYVNGWRKAQSRPKQAERYMRTWSPTDHDAMRFAREETAQAKLDDRVTPETGWRNDHVGLIVAEVLVILVEGYSHR